MELARRVPRSEIVGVEVSEEMCAQAERNMAAHGIANVFVLHLSALDMAFESEFDAVFSNSAIHWIKDQEGVYARMYRALKPGGRILVQTGLNEPNPGFIAVVQVISRPEFRGALQGFTNPTRFLTREKTEKILRDAGFQAISVESYPYALEFPSDDDALNYYRGALLVPVLTHLPAALHDAFIQAFNEAYLTLTGDQARVVKMKRLFTSAEKSE